MPIWFVYRSPYDGPLSKHVRRLDGPDTLLGWFRHVWRHVPDVDDSLAYAESLLGTHVYAFGYLFRLAAQENHPPPATDAELHARLDTALYVQGFDANSDAIQVLSDDDELCMAMYWFTDTYAAANPDRVAWLLQDWPLPDAAGPGAFAPVAPVSDLPVAGSGDGALFVWDWPWETSSDLEDGGSFERLAGVRLAGLVPWLLTFPVEEADTSNVSLIYSLRGQLRDVLGAGEGMEASFRHALLDDPSDPATWAAYTDWLSEQDLPRAELRLLVEAVRLRQGQDALIDLGAHHLCVASHDDDRNEGRYNQWIFFDDLWAGGNATLAQSLVAYAGRWDVL